MKRIQVPILFLLALVLLSACRNGATNGGDGVDSDSVPTDTGLSLLPPDTINNEKTDASFDDFLYNFMRNADFQLSRTKFPLEHIVDGKRSTIEKAAWHHKALHASEPIVTMLFTSRRAMASEKDTSLTSIQVERIDLTKSRFQQYSFQRIRRHWQLTQLAEGPLSANANADFYTFYARFAKSPRFQQQHIANPFEFRTYDSDSFEPIEGLLDPAQWADFKPSLPTGVITNINFAQHYADQRERVMVITATADGLSSTLCFSHQRKTWVLTRLENV